ncbi:hypothetical protein EGI16_06985 [Chryseobacterium sp. G0240]|nr:hypothetical protein EGI16_06985 [Chryseobacterium sp. G0240]
MGIFLIAVGFYTLICIAITKKRVIIGNGKFVVILKKVAVYLPDFELTVTLYVNPLLSEAKPEVSKKTLTIIKILKIKYLQDFFRF